MNKNTTSILAWFDNIISFFEKERFTLLTMFIWIFILSAIRMWMEAVLFNYPYQELTFEYFFNHAHIISFYFTVFIGGVLIVTFFSKQKLAKVANLSAIGFVMILLPPLIDAFILQDYSPYYYIPLDMCIETILSFFMSMKDYGGMGLLLEMISILIFTSMYIFIKTRSLTKSIGNFICFYFFIILVATQGLGPLVYVLFSSGYARGLIQPVLIVRYIAISMLLLTITLKITKKGLLSSFLKSSRLTTTAHFAIMTLIGILIAGHLQIDSIFSNILNPTMAGVYAGNIGTLGISLFSIIFLWQYSVMINHVYDIDIDQLDNKERLLPKNMITTHQVKSIAIIYAILSAGLAALLGTYSLLLVLLGLFLGTIYSVPPLRLRNGIFSTMVIGIGSAIAYFIGYVTPTYMREMHGALANTNIRNYPTISTDSIIIGVLIFITLSIGSLIKDYKDYEGDKKAGVRNLFTIYGLEKGITITSILLPFTFISPLLLFHNTIDFLVFIPLGIIAGITFKKYKNTQYVFALYFPILIYCLLRWFAIL